MRSGQAIAAAALVLAVLAVGAVLVLTANMNIDRVGDTICPEDSRPGRLDETGTRACTVVNTTTREVTFGVTIRNSGNLPVTVTGFPLEPLDLVGFTPDAVVEGTPPFRLEPDDMGRIVVRGRLPACEVRTTGGATTFTSLGLHVRALGVTRSIRLPLDPAVRLIAEPC